MPRQKIVTLYYYDELPTDEAKERVRDWYREGDRFSEYVEYDDFLSICEAMGVAVGTRTERWRIVGGQSGSREVPTIFWSGFWSQGDGASFTGTFKLDGAAGEKIRAYAPLDEKLHRIADGFDALHAQRPGLCGSIVRPYDNHYAHQYTMYVELDDDEGDEALAESADFAKLEEEARDLCRDLAGWLYRSLESEYEYRNSDEEVAEALIANEYTFTEDGDREN